jgi:hypothetical protein
MIYRNGKCFLIAFYYSNAKYILLQWMHQKGSSHDMMYTKTSYGLKNFITKIPLCGFLNIWKIFCNFVVEMCN